MSGPTSAVELDLAPVVQGLLEHLEGGWNAADGERFAEPFAEDADFVTIRGEFHRQRIPIARGHAGILSTIYRGSKIRYRLLATRRLRQDVALAHVESVLQAPQGPLAGVNRALASLLLVQSDGQWQIAAFHNTHVAPAGAASTAS